MQFEQLSIRQDMSAATSVEMLSQLFVFDSSLFVRGDTRSFGLNKTVFVYGQYQFWPPPANNHVQLPNQFRPHQLNNQRLSNFKPSWSFYFVLGLLT